MVELTGVAEFTRYFNSLLKDTEVDVEKEQKQMAEDILKLSNTMIPVDTGDLKKSGHIVKEGKDYKVVYDAKHAMVVHEDLTVVHKSGTAKYLEKSASHYSKEAITRLENIVKNRI